MRESHETVFVNAGLSRVASQLKKLVLPSLRLTRKATYNELLSVGTSKLGGTPDISPEVFWPTWKGMPLAFVAQINLAEVPPLQEGMSLPSSGLLSFFYAADQTGVGSYDPASRGGWRVLYDEGEISRLQRRPFPPSLKALEPPMHYGSFPACALTFSVESTYAPAVSEGVEKLCLSQKENDAYWNLLAPLYPDEKNPRHRLLGHPDVLQGDMQIESQLVSHDLSLGDGWPTDQRRVEQVLGGAQDWQLLLQLETDPEAEMVWGIEGRIYYWIQTQALQKHDFEQVWCSIQWA